jgi:hypothetical protein
MAGTLIADEVIILTTKKSRTGKKERGPRACLG